MNEYENLNSLYPSQFGSYGSRQIGPRCPVFKAESELGPRAQLPVLFLFFAPRVYLMNIWDGVHCILDGEFGLYDGVFCILDGLFKHLTTVFHTSPLHRDPSIPSHPLIPPRCYIRLG